MKVAVIGAGIGGIAASIRLAAKGYSVLVLENTPTYGGKLNVRSGNGYRFDTGPSLFTLPELVEELLQLGGNPSNIQLPYATLDPLCHYFYPDGTFFSAPSNPDLFAKKMAETFGENELTVRKYLSKNRQAYNITAPVFLERTLHKVSAWINWNTLKGILLFWKIDMFRSMHASNAKKFRNPKTVQFFDRFATYNGSSPYKAPATLNVIPTVELYGGAYLPNKGMRNIVDVLYQKALSLGVEFRFKQRVTQIVVKSNMVAGVQLENHDMCLCDIVVSNADAKKTYTHLLQAPMPQKLQNAENSSSALVFYWGVNTRIHSLDVHNILFSQDYREEFRHLFELKELFEDPTIYIHISSRIVKGDAPEGCDNLFVMLNAPSHVGQDWPQITKNARQWVLDRIEKQTGVNIESYIEFEEVLTPADIENLTGSHQGSIYGTASNDLMSAFNRQANFSSSIKGLYFCGGSVHPGGGIPLCLLGAKIVSGLIPSSK